MTRAAAIAVLVLGACGGDDAPTTSRGSARPVLSEGAGRTVVATVDGRPIYADCVQTQAAAHGLTARAALDECIDFELLAMEAERRGYGEREDVQDTQRREAVRALIARDFETAYDGPEDIPADEVERLWKNPVVHSKYNHPEYRFCVYVRAPVDATVPRGSPADLEAKAAIETAWRATRDKAGWYQADWFAAIREAVGDYPLEYQEKLYNTPRKGKSDESFARALFEIDAVRSVSKPARTKWGWDLLLLLKTSPERRTRMAEVEDELREQLWTMTPASQCKRGNCDTTRQLAFKRWSADIAKSHDVSVADRAPQLVHTPTSR